MGAAFPEKPLRLRTGSCHHGSQQHANLLASVSRFLITEEDAHNPTGNPLINMSTWRYYAEIPQLPNPGDTLQGTAQKAPVFPSGG